jgi:hypothetical protein
MNTCDFSLVSGSVFLFILSSLENPAQSLLQQTKEKKGNPSFRQDKLESLADLFHTNF